jgi:hypothetical protein
MQPGYSTYGTDFETDAFLQSFNPDWGSQNSLLALFDSLTSNSEMLCHL